MSRTTKMKITLKNDLVGLDVRITEGNADVTRNLSIVKPGSTFVLYNDPNATYREYFFITLPDNNKLRVLTSDDFAEYKKISVFEENGTFDWMGTVARKSAGSGAPAQGGLLKQLFRSIGLM